MKDQRIEAFKVRLKNKGIIRAYVSYIVPEREERHLCFEKEAFFILKNNGKRSESVEPTAEQLIFILESLNNGRFRFNGYGQWYQDGRVVIEPTFSEVKGGIH